MANSATADTATQTFVMNANRTGTAIIPVRVTIEDTDDLTIYTPASDQYVGVFGIQYTGPAHTLTVKSGTQIIFEDDYAANTPVKLGMSANPYYQTRLGEALVISSSVAINAMLIYVATFRTFDLS